MLNFKQQDYGTDCAWDIVTGCSKCAPACKYCHVLRCKTQSDENLWHLENVKFAGGNMKTAVAVCKKLENLIDEKVFIAIIRDVFKEHCTRLTQITLDIGVEIDDSFILNLLDQQTGQSKPV